MCLRYRFLFSVRIFLFTFCLASRYWKRSVVLVLFHCFTILFNAYLLLSVPCLIDGAHCGNDMWLNFNCYVSLSSPRDILIYVMRFVVPGSRTYFCKCFVFITGSFFVRSLYIQLFWSINVRKWRFMKNSKSVNCIFKHFQGNHHLSYVLCLVFLLQLQLCVTAFNT